MIDIDTLLEVEGLCVTDIEGYRLHWRMLTMKEYNIFRSLREGGVMLPFFLHEMVFDRCFIGSPTTLSDDMPAGITASIGELCMWVSGDCEKTTLKDEIQAVRQSYPNGAVLEHMKRVVILAMPHYSLDMLNNWTREKLFKTFTFAEHLLVARGGEYEMMDLRKISSSEKTARPKKSIDFNKENAELDRKLGHREKEERERPSKLSTQAARALDQRSGPPAKPAGPKRGNDRRRSR